MVVHGVLNSAFVFSDLSSIYPNTQSFLCSILHSSILTFTQTADHPLTQIAYHPFTLATIHPILQSPSFSIILTASLFSIACGLLGSFLVLRKMAMIGDAISHAVLPGIVIGYLVSGSRDSIGILIGAGLLGLLSTYLIEGLHRKMRLQTDAAIGLVFTGLFALGIILISLFAGQVDLDQECVLYGEIAYVPLDLWVLPSGTVLGPRPLFIALVITILVILFLWLGYKHLQITSFDPAYAASIGISLALWNYLLMGAVSVTTVAAFESVGAILVVALFVVPPATAYLLTNRLSVMLVLTCVIAVVASLFGYFLASWTNGSIAGAMVVVSGILFTAALLYTHLNKK